MPRKMPPQDQDTQTPQNVKQKKRRFPLKWILFGAVLVYAGITLISQQSMISAQAEESGKLGEAQAELEQQIDFLESEKEYIGTDAYIEQEARDKLGWVKDDEIIFKVEESEAPKEDGAEDDDSQPSPSPSSSEEPDEQEK